MMEKVETELVILLVTLCNNFRQWNQMNVDFNDQEMLILLTGTASLGTLMV
jgi:hypothetical protein